MTFSSRTVDLSRLSLNAATLTHTALPDVITAAAQAGYGGVGLWRHQVQKYGTSHAARLVADAGLTITSLCRGGFFTALDPERTAQALHDNHRAIDEAAEIGTRELIMVVGGLPANPSPGEPVSPHATQPQRDLTAARQRVSERLHDLVPYARERNVRLVLEPMHPIFCADRGVISTLTQALDLAAPFSSEDVGVVVDTYHVWWDPALREAIERAGREGRIASYQICDWVLPLKADTLNSRGYVGDGYIDFTSITQWITDAGYRGLVETEIFNTDIWASPRDEVVAHVARDYATHVLPWLTAQ